VKDPTEAIAIALDALELQAKSNVRLAEMIYGQLLRGHFEPLALLDFIAESQNRLARDVSEMRRFVS
jgi:hypothetical protein